MDSGVPGNCRVLTTGDVVQAFEHTSATHGYWGRDAALTAIEMAVLDRKLADDGITTKRS